MKVSSVVEKKDTDLPSLRCMNHLVITLEAPHLFAASKKTNEKALLSIRPGRLIIGLTKEE